MMQRVWLDDETQTDTTQSLWARYRVDCTSRMSDIALDVLDADCEYIVRQILDSRPNRAYQSGLVMGAVQSGKTASMLGVVAKAIDRGVDIVVILGGTRVGLWLQTYTRLQAELDPEGHPLRSIVVPARHLVAEHAERPRPAEMYALPSARVRAARRRGQPLVFVVMKQVHHLEAASRVLRESVYPNLSGGGPLRVIVLDDEADDGSVLDAELEKALDPATDHLKQIPRFVADLWSARQTAPAPVHPTLQVTYLAYTATPQANFLQSDQNPLSPRDFVCALRTPYDTGSVLPRGLTYRESGLRSYYTGGDAFYVKLEDAAPEARLTTSLGEQAWDGGSASVVAHALRAYLVAGAVRTLRGATPVAVIAERAFATKGEAVGASPKPHTMLFHPSSAKEDHFAAAALVLAWGRGLSYAAAERLNRDGERSITVEAVAADMRSHEDDWIAWLEAYRASAVELARAFNLEAPVTASVFDWESVRQAVLDHVVPAVRVAVVNSDPEADDRPEFEPQLQADGTWRPARDLMTIFVSGNVMARGLTLTGLTTTLFLRTSDSPAADTQVQMQRWFGYRGEDLELCRVLAPAGQVALFKQYHEVDLTLRTQILAAMDQAGDGFAPSPLVLEGARFAATAKIAGVSKIPLCPGATPYINHVNVPVSPEDAPDPNLSVLISTFRRSAVEVTAGGRPRGLIVPEPLSMLDAAELLDRLRYSGYRPAYDDPLAQRWTAQEQVLELSPSDLVAPLLRLPDCAGGQAPTPVEPTRCPYTVAAYLRLWSACLSRRLPGHFATDDADVPWSHLDLAERRRLQPSFYVGLRFGSGSALNVDGLDQLSQSVFPMVRARTDGRVYGDWGSQGRVDPAAAYHGDKLFDYAYHRSQPVPVSRETGALWRPLGSPGLILFQLILPHGATRPSVAVGVGLPLGGPDHFAARTRSV